MAALAYPLWFAVFPMVYVAPDKRNNPFLRTHAYQGAALGLFGIVGLSLVRAVLGFFFRWLILFDVLLYPLLRGAEWTVLALVVYGALMAGLGRLAPMPYITGAVNSLFADQEAKEDQPAD
jgi:hypothetical protein